MKNMKLRIGLLTICLIASLLFGACADKSSEAPAADSEDAKQQAEEQSELLQAFGSNDFPTSLGSFTAEDLDGNQINESFFGNADVTIVHIWATYCDPCLEEMENLGKMADALPENAQMLGLVADLSTNSDTEYELAKKIVSEKNVHFTNVFSDKAFTDLYSNIVGVPTTFIVDSEGNVVGEPIIGSNVLGYKSLATDYLKTLE